VRTNSVEVLWDRRYFFIAVTVAAAVLLEVRASHGTHVRPMTESESGEHRETRSMICTFPATQEDACAACSTIVMH
jgi:hypothetical protein